jgi:two-component system, chemotaxis family, chemotaxis protein CheY
VKILIVDDSTMMRAIVKRTLGQAGFSGHEIAEASDGAAAMAHVGSAPVDMILADWNMPKMTGIEFLRALRAAGDHTPFVFVTSEGTPEIRALASTEGATALIEKPFTPEAFKAALGSHIR